MTTLFDAIEDFLLAKKAGQRAASTIVWYQKYLYPFREAFAAVPIEDFAMRQVASWLTEQTGGEYTLFNRDRALRTFFKWSARFYHVRNPMKAIPVPRLPEPEPKAIEADDLNKLIDACQHVRDSAILIVLADCGLRASGLISLSIDDVDFAAMLIRVREKRGSLRAVPFSPETERALTAWCKVRPLGAERLFCTFKGGPLSYWGLRQIIRRLAERCGFTEERCNLHSIRHFAAREYLKQGGNLPALARILGHRTINTTSRYYAVYGSSELAEVHAAHSPLNSLKKKDTI